MSCVFVINGRLTEMGLGAGLTYHQESGRGLLPAGLVKESRALEHQPLP